MASTMLLPCREDYGRAELCRSRVDLVSDVPKNEPPDVPKEEQIKARLRELTEDSRRLRQELEQLIRYVPDLLADPHDRPIRNIRSADRRRKPR